MKRSSCNDITLQSEHIVQTATVYSRHPWDPNNLSLSKRCPYFRQRFIYTHLYCNGTTSDCPYYRGVFTIKRCPCFRASTMAGLTEHFTSKIANSDCCWSQLSNNSTVATTYTHNEVRV